MQEEPVINLDINGDIWRFALDFYSAPGVSDACLRLQDEAGIDVVTLIIILYADTKLKRSLSADEIATLRTDTERWREETVLPLRVLRRRLKNPAPEFPRNETEALRNLIKKAELRAEQIQLAMGENWLGHHPAQDGLPVGQALALLCEGKPNAKPADFSTLIERLTIAAIDTANR